jgi:hypothetical protein
MNTFEPDLIKQVEKEMKHVFKECKARANIGLDEKLLHTCLDPFILDKSLG